ncbi:MAG: type II toxin-antitoxin system HicA family toxin [Candidatus Desantisbacteria bacterium]
MRYGEYTLPIPGNQEYSVDQLKVLLLELKEALGRKIVLDEWVGL